MTSASFDRVYGGIAICVARLAKELSLAGASVALWAPDGSAKSSDLIAGNTEGIFALEGPLEEAVAQFSAPDLIHDHGIWLPHNHALAVLAKRLQIPRIVSVHGMLEPWAVKHKRLKKRAAWHMYQKRDLMHAQRVHATADAEKEALVRAGIHHHIVTIPNGTDLPDLAVRADREGRQRVALFLSRIHPKKGLPMLLEAWAELRPENWALHIAGPDEGGHRADIEALANRLNIQSQITFLGPLNGAQVSTAYAAADLFVLPTHSENFGLVITEALAHKVPVLTTTGAPWRELETENCGWWVTPSIDGVRDGLKQAFAVSDQQLQTMGENGRRMVAQKYSWHPIAKAFLNVYESTIAESV